MVNLHVKGNVHSRNPVGFMVLIMMDRHRQTARCRNAQCDGNMFQPEFGCTIRIKFLQPEIYKSMGL